MPSHASLRREFFAFDAKRAPHTAESLWKRVRKTVLLTLGWMIGITPAYPFARLWKLPRVGCF